MRHEFSRANQGLGGYAAGIEAITAHLMLFDQGYPGLNSRGYIRADQPASTGPYHHHVSVERFGPGKVLIDLARSKFPDYGFGN